MSKGFSNPVLLEHLLSGPYQHYVEVGSGDWRDPTESNPALSLSAEGWFDHKNGTGGHLSSLADEHIMERHHPDSLMSRGVESKCSLNDSKVKSDKARFLWEELAQCEELAIDFLKSYLTVERQIPLENYDDLIASGLLRYLPASRSNPAAVIHPIFSIDPDGQLLERVTMIQLIRSQKSTGTIVKNRKVKIGSGGHGLVLPPLEASDESGSVITEGLENALSFRNRYPKCKIFITFGKSNFHHVPRLFSRGDLVILIADHDKSANLAQSGQFAASELRKSLVAQGVSCQALMPPRPGWDANAAMCAGELDEWLLGLVPVPNMSSLLSEHGALTLSPIWGIQRRSEMSFPERSWLIEGLLEARTLSVMAGPPGAGKSFLALDIACCIQSGKPWHGRAVDQGDVLYLGAEGTGLESRLTAWENLNQIGDVDLLLSECRGQDLADQAESFAALMEELPRVSDNLKLIVIDTLSKLSTADENIASEVGKVFRNVDQLRLLTQAAVLLVHHTGWRSDRQLRGSTAILAAVDHHLGVTRSNSVLTLRSEKSRDTSAFKEMNFELVNVDHHGGYMEQVSFGYVAPKLLEGFDFSASSRKESRVLQKKSSAKFSEMQKIFIDNFKIISNQNGHDGNVTQEELRENMKRSIKSFSSSNWRDLVNAKTLAKYFKFDSGKVSQIAELP